MKTAFLHELKRILLPLCVFTVIATALFLAFVLATPRVVVRSYMDETGQILTGELPGDTLVYVPSCILGILCYLVPAMQYSYRMNRRSVDLWYSLPIHREKLLLVRTLGGFLLVFVPYIVSYALGVSIIGSSYNLFEMSYYAGLFFASLLAGLLLYGLNAFLFTRANKLGDGIAFMLLGTFLLTAPQSLIMRFINATSEWRVTVNAVLAPLNFMGFGALAQLSLSFHSMIIGGVGNRHAWIAYTLSAFLGCASWFGLFYTARSHRAESAEQISDSWFGYRVQIPVYLFFFTASIDASSVWDPGSLFLVALIYLVLGAAAYFVYRRSFRLRLREIVPLLASFLAGTGVVFLFYFYISS